MSNRIQHHNLSGRYFVTIGIFADVPVIFVDSGKCDPHCFRKRQFTINLHINGDVPDIVLRLHIFHRDFIQPFLWRLHLCCILRIDPCSTVLDTISQNRFCHPQKHTQHGGQRNQNCPYPVYFFHHHTLPQTFIMRNHSVKTGSVIILGDKIIEKYMKKTRNRVFFQ